MSQTSETRQHETTIEISASPEQVWEALTKASEVQKWFAPEARVDARAGGEYFVSWGPGMEGAGTIQVFEPGCHLRTVTTRESTGGCGPGEELKPTAAPVRLAVDYYLEGRGGGTVLRLVHSGFLTSSEWDQEYDGTRKGWPVMLRIMKHGLECHAGIPGRQTWLCTLAGVGIQEAWERLAAETAGAATVVSAAPDELCRATPDTLVYGVFDACGGQTAVSLTTVAWGAAAERYGAFVEHWRAVMNRLYAS